MDEACPNTSPDMAHVTEKMDKASLEKASLATLPTEIRLQILAESTIACHSTPARQSPSSQLHGLNPLLRVSRQIRAEALTLPQPTAVTVVHVNDLDREVGRRNVEERDLFQKLLVVGLDGEDGARDIEIKLKECWMMVERAELPADWEGDILDGRAGAGQIVEDSAACFRVQGACMCWSYYPWYMQAGYELGWRMRYGVAD